MKLLKRIMAMLCVILLVTDICLPYGLAVYGREDYETENMMAAEGQPETTESDAEKVLPIDEAAAQSEETQGNNEIEPTEGTQTEVEGTQTDAEPTGETAQPSENQDGETAETEEPNAEFVQTTTYEDDEVKVDVTAVEPNAIPENAALKVVPIVEKELAKDMTEAEIAEIDAMNAQYKEVAEKLAKKAENEAYDIAGFLAYDISLVDKDGNKVEPNGEVKVSMDYKKAVIPEEAAQAAAGQSENTQVGSIMQAGVAKTDAGQTENTQTQSASLDVTVMHFEEDANGQVKEIVDMVADEKTEASVQTTEKVEVEKTEFVTDSFSTFTITWTKGSGRYAKTATITVHYVDTDGNEIPGTQTADLTPGQDRTIFLSDYAQPINGKAYERIAKDTYSGLEIKRIRYHIKESAYGSYYDEYIIQYSQSESGNDWQPWLDITSASREGDIYIVYPKTGTTPSAAPTPTATPAPSATRAPDTPPRIKEKYVEKHDDGTYDLTLDVSGKAGDWEGKVKLDVVFVLDVSGSMQGNPEDNDTVRDRNKNRLWAAREAIKQAVGIIDGDSQVDARYSLVGFSSGITTAHGKATDSEKYAEWTANKNTLITELDKLTSPQGATNYQAGLQSAQSLIGDARSGATTVVVFVSDGDPTTYYGSNGYSTGLGDRYDQRAMDAAQDQLRTMTMDQFYTVGVGPSTNYGHLTELSSVLKGRQGVTYGYYSAAKAEDMKKVFGEIAENVIDAATRVPCTNVTITDTLSEYAEIAGTTPELQIVVKQINSTAEGGTTLTPVAGTGWTKNPTLTLRGDQLKYKLNKNNETFKKQGAKLNASYDSATKQVVLDFPDDYWLEPDYIYYVKVKIKPTAKAMTDYKANIAAKRLGYAVNEGTEYVAHQGDPDTDANSEANANATGHNTITSGTTITSSDQYGFYANSEANVAYWNQQEAAGTEKRTASYPKPVIQVTDPISKAKYIKYNDEDESYDLTLNVKAMPEQQPENEPVDIVLVLDRSFSMLDNGKISTLRSSVTTMIDQVDGGVDVKWEVNSFDGSARNEAVDPSKAFIWGKPSYYEEWTTAENAKNIVKDIDAVTLNEFRHYGTNYEDAFTKTAEVLNNRKNNGRKKIVVFVTDGLPEYWSGLDQILDTPFYDGMDAAPNVNCDEFYAVGLEVGTTPNDYGRHRGDPNGTYYGELTPEGVLNEVTNRVNAPVAEKHIFSTQQADLSECLQSIARNITNNRCKNVVISDTLTDYVQLKADTSIKVTMKNSDEKNSENNIVATAEAGPFTAADLQNVKGREFEVPLRMTDGTGTEVTKVKVKYEPTKSQNNGSNGKITLTFPPEYTLKKGMVYDITMKIEPTNDAVNRYIQNGNQYKVNGTEIKGDPGTDDVRNDTSSGKPGFHSNVTATVDYNYNGKTYTGEEYDHPVVQVKVTESKKDVTVTKAWKDGHDKYKTRPDKITFKLQYSKDGNEPWTWYTGTEGTTPIVYEIPNPDKGTETVTTDTWTSKVEDLPGGYTYKAVEIDVPEGYTSDVKADGDHITVTNTLDLDWKIIKQSSSVDQNNDTHPVLDGAVFSLTKEDAPNDPVYYGISGKPKKSTSDEGAGSGEDAGSGEASTPTATPAPDGELRWYKAADYQAGHVDETTATTLPDGTYNMTEIKAPIGFAKSNTTWELTVEDGILTSVKVGGVEKLNKNAKVGNEVKFFIDNVAIYELPSAAGPGIYRYLISGMLCMIAAALVLYKNMHREEVMEK